MSTGIGMHKYKEGTNKSVWSEPIAYCPYCNEECYADYVDVGIGKVQCGPYYCQNCGASEASSLDTRELTDIESKTGWYAPHTKVSEHANTCKGVLVDHITAKKLYDVGLLDIK